MQRWWKRSLWQVVFIPQTDEFSSMVKDMPSEGSIPKHGVDTVLKVDCTPSTNQWTHLRMGAEYVRLEMPGRVEVGPTYHASGVQVHGVLEEFSFVPQLRKAYKVFSVIFGDMIVEFLFISKSLPAITAVFKFVPQPILQSMSIDDMHLEVDIIFKHGKTQSTKVRRSALHVVFQVVTLKQGKGVVVRLFTVPIKFHFTLGEFGVVEAAHCVFTGVFTFYRVGF